MSKLVRNERRKLLATFLNGVAIAAIGIGGLSQAAAMVQNGVISISAMLFVMICLAVAGVLHSAGRLSLRGMEE